MDLNVEQVNLVKDNKQSSQINCKRKCENDEQVPNRKICIGQRPALGLEDATREHGRVAENLHSLEIKPEPNCDETQSTGRTATDDLSLESKELKSEVPQSSKNRVVINNKCDKRNKNNKEFIYGNYSQYYGYRNGYNNCKNQEFQDIRLNIFQEYKNTFRNKQVLDIGCNNGLLTLEIAKQLEVKSIVGLDIDKQLIKQAVKSLTRRKKMLPMDNEFKRLHRFPFNVTFMHGNYVLRDQVLLEIERPQFDIILCLSTTKWIHLNFGDAGLKLAFKRIFLQLNPKGVLILEAQPYDNYGRRKKMTDTIFQNYKSMKFYPKDFDAYLLSSEVGFSKMELMGVPDHCQKGFKRPIQIFYKE